MGALPRKNGVSGRTASWRGHLLYLKKGGRAGGGYSSHFEKKFIRKREEKDSLSILKREGKESLKRGGAGVLF